MQIKTSVRDHFIPVRTGNLHQVLMREDMDQAEPAFIASRSISSVQSLSHVWLFVTPWTAARQASLSITNSQSLLKLMSIESVMPSNHLILCHPLLLLPSILPSIRLFQWVSSLHQFSSVTQSCPSLCGPMDCRTPGLPVHHQLPEFTQIHVHWVSNAIQQSHPLLSLSSPASRIFSNTIVRKHQFLGAQLSSWTNSHIYRWLLEKT